VTALPLEAQNIFLKLTSPPLTYSITKHKRSFVWKEYFKDLQRKQQNQTNYHLVLTQFLALKLQQNLILSS